ncbi:MAG TPA: SAM-dependent methyltransferase [Gaiellaceae bacterium]|nr:SAM-dependent methyltransferase [Gaiellaceae bacterium]
MPQGSLTVVGTGIAFGVQLTPQARAAIARADDLFYLLAEATGEAWLEGLNASSHSLRGHYAVGRPRRETYAAMVEQILAAVRRGRNVCAAFYGHPGVFASPAHDAVRRARAEGFPAVMLPAISAEDSLFADVGLDPGERGCQSYEATDFLARRPAFDTSVPLILWQVAFVGIRTAPTGPSREGFAALVECLLEFYDEAHPAIVYQASPYPVGAPQIEHFTLGTVRDAELGGMSTLYVPPVEEGDETL